MPLRQYLIWVGSVLLVVLFAADWCLPAPVVHRHSEVPPRDTVNLRIRSDHRWPERIVFDTAHWPSAAAPPELNVASAQGPQLQQRSPLDAFASIDPAQV